MFRRRLMLAVSLLIGIAALATVPDRGLAQQEGAVEGTVTDAGSGQPLAGAQVYVEGTDIGTLTGQDGNFRITGISTGQVTLAVQLIGYASASRQVQIEAGQVATADFAVSRSAVEMESIIVTGTPGATVKREIGNAVSQIDATELAEKSSAPSMEDLLAERQAGVTVLPGDGNVGTGAPIRLRGNSSFTLSGQPLVYIDGVRMRGAPGATSGAAGNGYSRLSDLNMSDIESIEIIKGPAATTLYGTEASNGVIQIITKQGTEGQTEVTLRTRQGANWFRDAVDRIPTNYNTLPNGDVISQHLIESERAAGRDVFFTGHVQNYDLSIRGGGSGIGYFMSGSYDDEQGYVPNNWLEQFNTRVNLNAQVPLDINLTSNLSYVSKTNAIHPQGFSGEQGVIDMIMFGIPRRPETANRGFLRSPPEESYERDIHQDVNRITWSLNARQSPTGWFAHRPRAGLDVIDHANTNLWPRQPEGAAHFWGEQALGRKEQSEVEHRVRTFDYSGTATFDVTDALRTETSVGVQFFSEQTEEVEATGQVFPTPDVTTVSAAARRLSEETFVENKTLGVFVQEKFSWKNRLFVTVGVRGDDNSAFGEEFDFVTYPKVNASWIVSDESFWDVDAIQNLRLRAAWGKAGQQPDAFAAIRTFAPITGPGGTPALEPDNPGNPELKPETTSEWEAGFEAGLFEDQIGVDFTYYRQTTSDALLEKPVPPSDGFGGAEQFINVAEIENWGFEGSLRSTIFNSEDVGLDVAGSVTYNRNEVTDLGDRPPILVGGFGTVWIREGYPMGGLFSREVVEAQETEPGSGEFTRIRCAGGPENDNQPVPCGQAPQLYQGPPGPVWSGGLDVTTRFFNQLQLFASFNFHLDQRQFSITTFGRDAVFRDSERVNKHLRTPEERAEEALFINGQWIENQSYVGFRELSLSWSVPQELSSRFVPGGPGLRLQAAMQNISYPYIHDDFTDLDPAINRSGNNFSHVQQTMMPQPTSFTGTVTITF